MVVATGLLLQQRFSDPPLPARGTAATVGAVDKPGPQPRVTGFAPTSAVATQEISPRARDWVEGLSQPGLGSPLTMESATAWDEMFARLISSGHEAVPAIREFLSRNTDLVWDSGTRRVLGFDSARAAMFDALQQIRGRDAEVALALTLAETRDPREIALLTRNLELMAPGQYREAAVEAARLALAADALGASSDQDVAPLFEVLQRFGGDAIAGDLEGAAARWNYYATISLAQLPDGAGVASLFRLAEGSNSMTRSASEPAIRMLGSLANQNEEARAAFLELVRNDRIASSTWARLGPLLAGAEARFSAGVFDEEMPLDYGSGAQHVHLSQGNQNFWTGLPAVAEPAKHWERQLIWLDQLAAIATGPAPQAAIQEAWKLILVRLSPLTASVR